MLVFDVRGGLDVVPCERYCSSGLRRSRLRQRLQKVPLAADGRSGSMTPASTWTIT